MSLEELESGIRNASQAKRLQELLTIEQSAKPHALGVSEKPQEWAKRGLRVKHVFFFNFNGQLVGDAHLEVNHALKTIEWRRFYPTHDVAGKKVVTRGTGYGTLAHVLVLNELARVYPGLKDYLVFHGKVSEERRPHLEAMGLKRALSEQGLPFKDYIRRSKRYAAKRFGFSL